MDKAFAKQPFFIARLDGRCRYAELIVYWRNMLSTCAMIQTGKVYENLMINLKPSNVKLRRRVISIVTELCGCDGERAVELLDAHDWVIRDAVDAYKS